MHKKHVGFLLNLFNLKSLKIKLIAAFLLLIFIPVAFIAYISVSSASDDLIGKAEESLSNATKQSVSYYEASLNNIKMGYVSQIIEHDSLFNWLRLSVRNDKLADYDAQIKAKSVISRIGASYQNSLDRIVTIRSDNSCISYMGNFNESMNLANTDIYKRATSSKDGIWIEDMDKILKNNNNLYVLSYAKKVVDSANNETAGIVLIDIKEGAFLDILSSVHVGKGSVTYAITKNQKVIASLNNPLKDIDIEKNTILKSAVEFSKGKDEYIYNQKYNDINYIVSLSKSATTGWVFVTAQPQNEILSVINTIRIKVALLGIVFIVVAVIIGFMLSLSITKALDKVKASMEKAKMGNLSVYIDIKRSDELGQLADSFNSMIREIRDLVYKGKDVAERVHLSAEEISSISTQTSHISQDISKTIQEIAYGSSEQAAEADKSLGLVMKFAKEISNVVESVSLMENVSQNVRRITSDGIKATENLSKKTAETNSMTVSVVNKIEQLNVLVRGVNRITKLLDGLSEQTKLLALNASIEAARAGEAGKGFAVVADEVRKLAEQSSSATKEVNNTIKQIFNETQVATEMVKKAENAMKEQYSAVGDTSKMFESISKATNVLAGNIVKISEEVKIMDIHKNQVFSSIESTSAVTEETAASTEEVTASTEEQLVLIHNLDEMAQQLKTQAGILMGQMDKFK
ncbi:MAG TPA: methyl-accepting chemotaxis protein [Ruminiclostridium sp.]